MPAFRSPPSAPAPRPWCGLLVLLPLLLGCEPEAAPIGGNAEEKPLPMLTADTLTVELQNWPTIIRSQGSLSADELSIVGSRVAGRVAEIHFDLGDYVEQNAPLVTLDQAEFKLQVDQAESQLAQARAAVGLPPGAPVTQLDPLNAPPVRQERALWQETKQSLKRAAELREQSALSPSEYDQIAAAERVAEARYASALNGVRERIALIGLREAELGVARQAFEDAVIRAPISGFIRERQVAVGNYLAVGQAVGSIVRTNPLRFTGTVPERYAQRVAVGQTVKIRIESVAEPRESKITRVSPALDPLSRALTFEADIENADAVLRTGLFAEAEIVIQPEAEALVVPESALSEFAGAQKVWKVTDGVLGEQQVLVGQRRESGVEILQGLEVGDQILSDASQGKVARIGR